MEPQLRLRREGQHDLPLLAWRFDEPRLAIASSPLGGGIGPRRWIVNATVAEGYARRDPDRHLRKLGVSLGLPGKGVGLLTAVDVRHHQRVVDDDAAVVATVGIREPLWAAVPVDHPTAVPARRIGTINVVAFVPERLSEAALVNAVATIAEAKAQAFLDLGLPGTGTATDAVCVVCPDAGRGHPFGGPRSAWGARLARAAHRAVVDGARAQADAAATEASP